MKKLVILAVVVSTMLLLVVTVNAQEGAGATVLNPGEGKSDGFCNFGSFRANQTSCVRSPNGNGTLSCSFTGLPAISKAQVLKGFTCLLYLDGVSSTTQTRFVRTPSGQGHMTCQFN